MTEVNYFELSLKSGLYPTSNICVFFFSGFQMLSHHCIDIKDHPTRNHQFHQPKWV